MIWRWEILLHFQTFWHNRLCDCQIEHHTARSEMASPDKPKASPFRCRGGFAHRHDALKVFEPWQLVDSRGNWPDVIHATVSWVINGPPQGGNSEEVKKHFSVVTTSSISVENLKEMLINQCNYYFIEKQNISGTTGNIKRGHCIVSRNSKYSRIEKCSPLYYISLLITWCYWLAYQDPFINK